MTRQQDLRMPTAPARIHLAGIGGIGVSALAPALLRMGYEVTGTDPAENEVTARLAAMGVAIHREHRAENVEGAALVVASAAVKPENPELAAARRLGIPVWHRAQMLGQLLRRYKSMVIAGAHGKTTTTAMAVAMLDRAGMDPAAFVGGDLPGPGTNALVGGGGWAVAEGDESDGSFLHLYPDIALINNIDADHLDHYKDMDAILDSFRRFAANIAPDGWLAYSADCPRASAVAAGVPAKKISYGFSEGADIRGAEYGTNGSGWRCEVWRGGGRAGTLRLAVHGRMNYHNALGVLALAEAAGVPLELALEGLASYKGVRRRMEVKGETGGVTVMDDYAHHPAEIRSTLAALRDACPGRRLIGVFQPHLYSRTLLLLDDFAAAFDGADLAVLTNIYPAREAPRRDVSGETLAVRVRRRGTPALYLPALAEIPAFLREIAREGDVVVTLGAGDVWKAGEWFLRPAATKP